MKAADLRAKTPDQLTEELTRLRKEQFNFRFQRTSGQLDNPSRIRTVRRDIARIKTVLTGMKDPVKGAGKKKAAAVKKTAPAKKKKAKGE